MGSASTDSTAGLSPAPHGESRFWRRWLLTLALTTGVGAIALLAAVVAIDPFSTGRFALTQRVDLASKNLRLARTGLVRDPAFNAAVIGSSTGAAIDPREIGERTGWKVAQLSQLGALPAHQLIMARGFDRAHRAAPSLQIHVLDNLWCRTEKPEDAGWGSFPGWLVESSDLDYLSRILFPDAVFAAARRIGLWLGLLAPHVRPDGYEDAFRNWKAEDLGAVQRPRDGPQAGTPFPAMDALAQHLKDVSPAAKVLLAFAPLYAGALPVAGSAAERRLAECKDVARGMASARPGTVVLDLMTDNEISREKGHYIDQLHYLPPAARRVASEISQSIRGHNLLPP